MNTFLTYAYELGRFAADERAVTVVEYALLASLIAVVCIATLIATGGNLNGLYTRVCNEVTQAISGAPAC